MGNNHNCVGNNIHVEGSATTSTLELLKKLSTVRRMDQMKKELQNDRYIFDGMALAGQITLFYSKPNTGKTLLFMKLLVDAIGEGRIDAGKVFYINADDHFKGLVTKTEIAEKYGFEMISPAEAGIDPMKIISMLEDIAGSGEAKGVVIILDTLKKFADMMSKASLSALYNTLRRLIAKDATVILAGHANKYPNADGKLVYEGTADTMNDIDCAYVINLTSLPEGEITVEFVREKNRGDNVFTAGYTYKKYSGMTYQEMLDSVTKMEITTTDTVRSDVNMLLDKYESEILLIKKLLADGKILNQSEILKIFSGMKVDGDGLAGECSEKTIKACLNSLTGQLWTCTRGNDNAKQYAMKQNSEDYMHIKSGG